MKTYVVYYQRYPEDNVSSRSFTDKDEADSFFARKNEDFAYTLGRIWMETFTSRPARSGAKA